MASAKKKTDEKEVTSTEKQKAIKGASADKPAKDVKDSKKVPTAGKKTTATKTASKKTVHLKKLVIVESPSKAQTISKYLGKDYEVKASVGHIIDLPKSRLGVNLESFDPDYIVMRDKLKVMKDLRETAKMASEIILASDPDREGEAIAYHIRNDLVEKVLPKIKDREVPVRRIKFEEITMPAVQEAIKNPLEIDEKLVNAQQSRRVIDRLFGYQLSPLLWKKVKSRLSAGRVQSVALRLICERENEIRSFIPQEYWEIFCEMKKDKSKFEAQLAKISGKRIEIGDIPNEATATAISNELKSHDTKVSDLKTVQKKRSPNPPFITSTLQQTASTILGFSASQTMQIAQQLYEGVDLGKTRMGLITYMRTDSTRVSPIAMEAVRSFIPQKYGKTYLPDEPNIYKNPKASQDAHEAIRPSDVALMPEDIAQYLTPEQMKLYTLIWKRFTASQMSQSVSETYTIELENGKYLLTASHTQSIFDGFQRVYDYSKTAKEKNIPKNLKVGEVLAISEVKQEQKFTEPPPRYNDASIVRTMEELGIGRPSTYAPTIGTLIARYYIKKEKKAFMPTALGEIVNGLLVEHFPGLIDVKFTASMESELDDVETGVKQWKDVVKDFYIPFSKVLKKAEENIESMKGVLDEETEYTCEKCGGKMIKRLGRFGFFLTCSNWPECKNAKPIPLGKCPKCETGLIVQKKAKGRKVFFGCSNYPDCDFISNYEPADEKCPNDGSALFKKSKNLLICMKEGCGYEKKMD